MWVTQTVNDVSGLLNDPERPWTWEITRPVDADWKPYLPKNGKWPRTEWDDGGECYWL